MKKHTTDMCVSNGRERSMFSVPRAETLLSFALFAVGTTIAVAGVVDDAMAQIGSGAAIQYNAERIDAAVNAIMTYLEGSFGALIMAAAGVGAIMSAAFGQYKASLSLLVVAVGSFILRSLIGTFFNDVGIQP